MYESAQILANVSVRMASLKRRRVQGSYRFQNSKIQDFFQTFSKTIIHFSRLKVIKKLINTDLEKTQEQSFFHDALQTYGRY